MPFTTACSSFRQCSVHYHNILVRRAVCQVLLAMNVLIKDVLISQIPGQPWTAAAVEPELFDGKARDKRVPSMLKLPQKAQLQVGGIITDCGSTITWLCDLTYLNRGCNRDVYTGTLNNSIKIVVKLQESNWYIGSTGKEVKALQRLHSDGYGVEPYYSQQYCNAFGKVISVGIFQAADVSLLQYVVKLRNDT